jgi:predicted DNA-binding protein
MRGVSRPRPTKLPVKAQVRLPADLEERLAAYAERKGLTRSEAIRALIEAGLSKKDRP